MQTVGLRAGEEGDGAYWRARINNHRRPQMTRKARDEEERRSIGVAINIDIVIDIVIDDDDVNGNADFT